MTGPRRSSSSREIRSRARTLRSELTPAEQLLWMNLRNRRLVGFKFRRQHPIGCFVADFYCAEHRLIVEVDGDIHRHQQSRDAARTAWLEAHGYRVVRFSNAQVLHELPLVLSQIQMICTE